MSENSMTKPQGVTLWTLFLIQAVATHGQCPGDGDCKTLQIGTSQFTTRLLQCNGPSCTRALFDVPPRMVCVIRTESIVRIFLDSCSKVTDLGYFISNTASVVSLSEGVNSPSTAFNDKSCRTICGSIEVVVYKALNDLTLVANGEQIGTSSDDRCSQGLYVYPNAYAVGACPGGPGGQSGATGPPPKRRCPWQTRRRALLTITNGISVFAVGTPVRVSYKSYRLPLVEERNGELFYMQEYASHAVGANGTVEGVTAYTLQLARSKKYLVADVLNDTTLNYTGPNSTGLNLMDATEFPDGYAPEPDYRFFVQYNVTINNEIVSVFCPLFHRNHCLYAGASGYLRLAPVNNTDRSLEPTFVNPTEDALRHFVRYSKPPGSSVWWHVNMCFL